MFFTFQILNVFWRVFSLNQAIMWNKFEIINILKYFKTTSSLTYFKIYQLNTFKYQRFYCLKSSPLSPGWISPTFKTVLPQVSQHWFNSIFFCSGTWIINEFEKWLYYVITREREFGRIWKYLCKPPLAARGDINFHILCMEEAGTRDMGRR